jgi:hypothetical protein
MDWQLVFGQPLGLLSIIRFAFASDRFFFSALIRSIRVASDFCTLRVEFTFAPFDKLWLAG